MCTLFVLLICAGADAAGIFNLGVMGGVANDAGSVEHVTGEINKEMRQVSGATVTELETTYTPVFAVNLAYINDSLLIKVGWEYTTNAFYKSEGSVDNAGTVNKVEVDYSRYTFPVSFGLVVPLTTRDRFYFAGGINVSYVLMKVKQSNPSLFLYPGSSHTYSAYLSGTHLKFGAESLLTRNYCFAMEFTKYFGTTKKVKSEDGNSTVPISVNSFEITAGITYNLDFKI